MPRIVRGRRCAAVVDMVVAVLIVLALVAVGCLLGVEFADWQAAQVVRWPAGGL